MTEITKFDPKSLENESVMTPLGPVSCSFLAINDGDLHAELDRNAADLAFFSGWEGAAQWAAQNKSQELEEAEALVWVGLKSRRDDGERYTADDMKAAVRADPRVRNLKRELVAVEQELSQFKTVRLALYRKGDLLQTKVHLRRSEMTRDMSIAAASGAYRRTEERMIKNDDSN